MTEMKSIARVTNNSDVEKVRTWDGKHYHLPAKGQAYMPTGAAKFFLTQYRDDVTVEWDVAQIPEDGDKELKMAVIKCPKEIVAMVGNLKVTFPKGKSKQVLSVVEIIRKSRPFVEILEIKEATSGEEIVEAYAAGQKPEEEPEEEKFEEEPKDDEAEETFSIKTCFVKSRRFGAKDADIEAFCKHQGIEENTSMSLEEFRKAFAAFKEE